MKRTVKNKLADGLQGYLIDDFENFVKAKKAKKIACNTLTRKQRAESGNFINTEMAQFSRRLNTLETQSLQEASKWIIK